MAPLDLSLFYDLVVVHSAQLLWGIQKTLFTIMCIPSDGLDSNSVYLTGASMVPKSNKIDHTASLWGLSSPFI